MKYTVIVKHGCEGVIDTIAEYHDLTQDEAADVARSEAGRPENADHSVFVTWFRSSDGQHGYLNQDGNHAITGQRWGDDD